MSHLEISDECKHLRAIAENTTHTKKKIMYDYILNEGENFLEVHGRRLDARNLLYT
ncbi:hypothetical protein KFK09_018365 [Dendrobium nobile]|uniref:Uncharacterized protein n=1 Tax=Dendrobium nobile TaxID=94219 RepID=A0A8T3AU74_DENNO|nr:hypothetical protein KFK09_018365 [Dendrobium nobile]